MTMTTHEHGRSQPQSALFDRTIDDQLLRLRGLVLAGRLLAQRGASDAEVEEHVREADRVRAELARLIGDDGLEPAA